jgi:hypothetical protein
MQNLLVSNMPTISVETHFLILIPTVSNNLGKTLENIVIKIMGSKINPTMLGIIFDELIAGNKVIGGGCGVHVIYFME